MFYSVTNKYTPYKEITTTELVCPLSGEKDPMKLVLHQLLTDSTFIKQYIKKPFGVYYRVSDKKDIPASKWTMEMEMFFEEQKALSPVPNKGWKITTFGKFFAILAIVIMLIISWKVFETIVLNPIKKNTAYSELTLMPEVGDQYKLDLPTKTYDNIGKAIAAGVSPTWVEILQVSLDSVCVFKPLETLPINVKLEKSALEQLQEDGTYVGKFQVLDIDRISFIFKDTKNGFEARTYGNIENVKRKK